MTIISDLLDSHLETHPDLQLTLRVIGGDSTEWEVEEIEPNLISREDYKTLETEIFTILDDYYPDWDNEDLPNDGGYGDVVLNGNGINISYTYRLLQEEEQDPTQLPL